jgi:hypothetical protein
LCLITYGKGIAKESRFSYIANMSRKYKFHNPLEEGIVFKPEEYVYSSAIDYCGGKG